MSVGWCWWICPSCTDRFPTSSSWPTRPPEPQEPALELHHWCSTKPLCRPGQPYNIHFINDENVLFDQLIPCIFLFKKNHEFETPHVFFIEPGPRQSLEFGSLLSTYRAIPWSFKQVKCPGGLIDLHHHYTVSFQTYDCNQVYILWRLKESLRVIFWRNPSKLSWKSGLCWNSWKSRMEIVRLIARSRHVVWCRGG